MEPGRDMELSTLSPVHSSSASLRQVLSLVLSLRAGAWMLVFKAANMGRFV
jgi:hypothetical protein